MIERELNFFYNHNYKHIFDITTNNNQEILKIIDDLKEYKQGIWTNNKRKDIIIFKFSDIPPEINSFVNNIIVDNLIPLKLKIKMIENSNNKIQFKVKCNLINKLANLILKIINLKTIVTIINVDNNSSDVKIKYIIKSLLPSSFVEFFNNYIEKKFLNNFVNKIDNYLKILLSK